MNAILGAAKAAAMAGLTNIAADAVGAGVGEVLHGVAHPIEAAAGISRHTARAKGFFWWSMGLDENARTPSMDWRERCVRQIRKQG